MTPRSVPANSGKSQREEVILGLVCPSRRDTQQQYARYIRRQGKITLVAWPAAEIGLTMFSFRKSVR